MTRYQVVEGSQSAHCCFEFTVVDTTHPLDYVGRNGAPQYEPVCECWEEADARRIADALNAAEGAGR